MAFKVKSGGYELSPRYDTRKSFYGKAVVTEENGKKVLRSYGADVAYIQGGKAVVKGMYSMTTLRHIKDFLKQNGFKADNWAQIEKDYSPTQKQAMEEKQEEGRKADSMFKTTANVAMLGEVFGKTKKEKNDWKLRMLKAGLGSRGFIVPDDWDTLSEDEKERRLDNVLKIMRGKGG